MTFSPYEQIEKIEIARRSFLKMISLGALTFYVNGTALLLTPREAKAKDIPFTTVKADEVATLEAFGEILHPGAKDAGIAHFVDQQLGIDPNDCLLIAKFFNIEPPYINFYRAGLGALNALSQSAHQKPFAQLDKSAAVELVKSMREKNPPGWQGPPAPLVYLIVRGDALDMVYATMEDFAREEIPYMPHILPPRRW